MAAINFYGGEDFNLDIGGSGLGFYGGSFGGSVQVGDYNQRTYITDGNGVVQGPEVDNMIYSSATGVVLGQGGEPITLREVPNYQCTLKIRFTHDEAVKIQNAKARIYDRSNINLGASGVTCRAFSCQHYYPTQDYALGSGDTTWSTPAGSSVILNLPDSPGLSGISINNSDHTSSVHDFFIGLSASPDSIGSKVDFGFYFQCEYL